MARHRKASIVLRRHGEGHPLLGLGDEDLPGVEARVLQRRLGEIQLAAAGEARRLAHRGGEAAGAVVGDAAVEAPVAGDEQEVGHLLLGDRVADLDRRDRGALVQLLGGEGRPVDPVLADPAAGHDDQVAGEDLLGVGDLPVELGGHDPAGAAVDQGLSQVALVEDEAAVDRRDAALVAAVLHPLAHPFVDPPRMEDPRGQGLVVVGRRKAEDVGVEDELRPLAAAEGVAVDADDPRQGAAVGVEGRGGVVGLHLEDQVPVVVEADDPGVVGKDGEAPVAWRPSAPGSPSSIS